MLLKGPLVNNIKQNLKISWLMFYNNCILILNLRRKAWCANMIFIIHTVFKVITGQEWTLRHIKYTKYGAELSETNEGK